MNMKSFNLLFMLMFQYICFIIKLKTYKNGARGRQLQTERYATAIDLAKKGQFDDIDPELYLKYHTTPIVTGKQIGRAHV